MKGIVRDKARSVRDKARSYLTESSFMRDATQTILGRRFKILTRTNCRIMKKLYFQRDTVERDGGRTAGCRSAGHLVINSRAMRHDGPPA